MNRKRWIALLLAMVMALGLVGCGGKTPDAAPDPEPDQSTDGAVTVTDMIGREVTVIPGSYQRVVCIGAGALRIYSYVGDAALLCGVGAAALAAVLTPEEMNHLTALLQKPESAANAPQALADYIRIIREEHTKRTGGTDPLAAAMETYKDKKGYGGKRT